MKHAGSLVGNSVHHAALHCMLALRTFQSCNIADNCCKLPDAEVRCIPGGGRGSRLMVGKHVLGMMGNFSKLLADRPASILIM